MAAPAVKDPLKAVDLSHHLHLVHCFSANFFLHLFEAIILLVVFVFQGTVINFYIISHFKKTTFHYFWFVADFLVLVLFVWALTAAYQRLKITREGTGSFSLSPRKMTAAFDASAVGVLPLSWITWMVYSVILVAKIAFLFKTEIPDHLKPGETFGPQLLKVAIGSSAVIFMLFVEGHHDTHSRVNLDGYINSLVTSTAFEVLDSVTFLSILFVNESHVLFTYDMENCIVGLTAINLLLPTVAIYKLSVSDFGDREWPLGATVLYRLVHLLVINLPYLGIRIHLWTSYDHDVSMFVVKNVFGIAMTLRAVYPELVTEYRKCRKQRTKRRNVYIDEDVTLELAQVHVSSKERRDSSTMDAGGDAAFEDDKTRPLTVSQHHGTPSSVASSPPETNDLIEKADDESKPNAP